VNDKVSSLKATAYELFGYLPFSTELIWQYRRSRKRVGHYNLEQLRAALPSACAEAAAFARKAPPGKRICLIASIHYWVEYCTILGLALTGQGHQVALGYYPYADYRMATGRFDRRLHTHYTRLTLEPTQSLMRSQALTDVPPAEELPPELQQAVEKISVYDTQYVLQVEEVEQAYDFYRMRLAYNELTARTLLTWLGAEKPDLVLFPNGVVIEYGVAYQVARHLGLPVVTFEFSDKREQAWIAQDDEVIRQNTDEIWKACGGTPITKKQAGLIDALEEARLSAKTFGKSERLWQDVPPQGEAAINAALGLDGRPVVLLASNVLGDSLILGRNIFSRNMGEWILRTIEAFSRHPECQLVVRTHPGERYMNGPSMVDIIRKKYPGLPENVHVVGPLEKINTYDIMSVAKLGLVYTTTVGLEMVMRGIPVIVAGDTHYRGRGFTHDPSTWDEYFAAIEQALADLKKYRPTPGQVERARNYAYRFFFNYPRPFPWKIYDFWKDFKVWPLGRLLGEEGRARFGASFQSLVGGPLEWTDWDMG
jgi:Capsule polysaccharide biosynthesis protein